jgi:hypothetical protein
MALFDLNRSNDTPISTLKLASITPKDWPTLPAVVPSTTPIWVRTITFFGGVIGDDVSVSTANATNDYTPRNQGLKAQALGLTLAVDITKFRGWIGPRDPYSTAKPNVTLTGISPNTAVHGTAAIPVTCTGTNFTPYSLVTVDNVIVPTTYVSPTSLTALVTPKATAGTQAVRVVTYGVATSPQTFTAT